ncbi:MAG: response regulator [Gemmata sp.]|jgi:two-component system chemotaxis response regulator CheY
MRALVIDDSRAVRAFIRPILRELNLDVAEAGNGREGLDRLREFPDTGLVLVDWNMPVMDGLEFIRAVRADKQFDPVRIVMVTTEGESDRMNQALAAGADEYVMKPFTRDVLVAKLSMLDVFGE